MLEKLFLAGILTFTLSLFAQGHRSSSVGMTSNIKSVGIAQQINLNYRMVLSVNPGSTRKLEIPN